MTAALRGMRGSPGGDGTDVLDFMMSEKFGLDWQKEEFGRMHTFIAIFKEQIKQQSYGPGKGLNHSRSRG